MSASITETPRLYREVKADDASLHGVMKLPPEILLSIFHILQDICEYRSLQWIAITHVCQFWRNVALHHPSLWVQIFVPGHCQWIDEFVRRSHPLPIELCYDGGASPPDARAKRLILDLVDRLRMLKINSCSEDFLAHLNKSAPLLSRLELCQYDDEDVNIPRTLLRENMPLLRDVLISGFALPIGVNWLPNLRRLDLNGQWGLYDADSSGSSDISSFLRLLSHLPLLENLSVIFPFSFNSETSQVRLDAPVHLPRLTSLSIRMRNLRPALFLKYLIVNGPIKMKIRVMDTPDLMLVGVICEFFAKKSFATTSIVWRSRLVSFFVDAAQPQGLFLHTRKAEALTQFVLPILIPSCDIRVLYLEFPPSNWFDLENLETIEELRFYSCKPLRQLLDLSQTVTPFPSLRWVHLRDLDLAVHMDNLKEWVMRRGSATRLEGFCFINCTGVTIDDAQLLTRRHIEVRLEGTTELVRLT